jgi:hypothetical protein
MSIDLVIKAETEGLDTEEEVIELAIFVLDTKLYRSQGSWGRFLANLQETDLWAAVEAHYGVTTPAMDDNPIS